MIAHYVDESRWTSALLVCCSSSSDAAWVKETLLPLPWSVASLQFIERFRDTLQLHRLQAEFYTLKKHPGESVLVFSTRFERYVHRLRLVGPCLISQFISCLPQLMASQLQLFSITRPDLTLAELIRTAIALESTASPRPSGSSSTHPHQLVLHPGSAQAGIKAPPPPSGVTSPLEHLWV